jgi:hypothetical protein
MDESSPSSKRDSPVVLVGMPAEVEMALVIALE